MGVNRVVKGAKLLALVAMVNVSACSGAERGSQGQVGSVQISVADQREIFTEIGLEPPLDGQPLVWPDCGEIEYELIPVDLNDDGIREVFFLGGNACTSGMTGSTIMLFIRDAEGRYRATLGFPAAAYKVGSTGNLGYPDLTIIGRGFCTSVWRWTGVTYEWHENIPLEPRGCG